MAALTIRKLEPRIKERLRPRVARHGRSMEEEARAILAYATIAAVRARRGRPISVFDAQIAAIPRSNGAELATRNVADFDGCGVRVINPWG